MKFSSQRRCLPSVLSPSVSLMKTSCSLFQHPPTGWVGPQFSGRTAVPLLNIRSSFRTFQRAHICVDATNMLHARTPTCSYSSMQLEGRIVRNTGSFCLFRTSEFYCVPSLPDAVLCEFCVGRGKSGNESEHRIRYQIVHLQAL